MAPHDPVLDTARRLEPDRYLAALYAPEPARTTLLALAAFQGEITRVPLTVREPLLAEIKLQWWRDALAQAARGQATGHPIVDRLAGGLQSGQLPIGLLAGMIDAAAEYRSIATTPDSQVLRTHLHKSHGAAFTLAARALGATHSEALDEATQAAGLAYGLARSITRPGANSDTAARCRAALAEATTAAARLDSALTPGFLPLAMVSAYLKVASRATGEVSPLQRWWRLWRAQRTGRLA